MTTEEVYAYKTQVEHQINHLLQSFQELTKLKVESVKFKSMEDVHILQTGVTLNVGLWTNK